MNPGTSCARCSARSQKQSSHVALFYSQRRWRVVPSLGLSLDLRALTLCTKQLLLQSELLIGDYIG